MSTAQVTGGGTRLLPGEAPLRPLRRRCVKLKTARSRGRGEFMLVSGAMGFIIGSVSKREAMGHLWMVFVGRSAPHTPDGAQPMGQTLRYHVSIPDLHQHLAEVRVEVPIPASGSLSLVMPSWSPGSYLLREYGRHVQAFEASDDKGQALSWAKSARGTWQIEVPPQCAGLVVRYRLFCHDLNVRANHIEDTHAFLNGPSVFMLVEGRDDQPCEVTFQAPLADWRIHTALPRMDGVREAPVGSATLLADDFDHLADCPTVMAPVDAITFEAHGTAQSLVLIGRHSAPVERMIADMRTAIEASAEMFGGLPYDRYLTVILHNATGRGGLEHRDSTILMLPPHGYQTDAGYEDFLSLFSHEHFHVWNIKRIRPAVLGPFDYANENYTRALWLVEGVTCYYENVLLRRAGLMSRARFVELLGERLGTLRNTPGRKLHSLEQASFDAWIKLYRPDESSTNTSVSYYLKGEMAAWLLDLTIRAQTQGERSLDDVMLHLWRRYQETGEGVDEATLQATFEKATGCDLSDFFEHALRSRDDLHIEGALEAFGLRLSPAEAPPTHAWLGATTTFKGDRVVLTRVATGSPAQRAGLSAGDEIIAFDGDQLVRDNFKSTLQRLQPGDTVEVHSFRRRALRRGTLTFGEHPVKSFLCVPIDSDEDDSSNPAAALRRGWLDGELDGERGPRKLAGEA